MSLCGSPLEKIDKFIDKILLPAVLRQTTYVWDSLAFINKIEQLKIPPESKLVSFDMTNKYTNLTHDEMIQSIINVWPLIMNSTLEIPLPPLEDIISLLKIISENNELEFKAQNGGADGKFTFTRNYRYQGVRNSWPYHQHFYTQKKNYILL